MNYDACPKMISAKEALRAASEMNMWLAVLTIYFLIQKCLQLVYSSLVLILNYPISICLQIFGDNLIQFHNAYFATINDGRRSLRIILLKRRHKLWYFAFISENMDDCTESWCFSNSSNVKELLSISKWNKPQSSSRLSKGRCTKSW